VTVDGNETEIKLRISDPGTMRAKLEQAEFKVSRERVFEANTVYDTPEGILRQRGTLLRLREVGRQAILTFKGPATPGKHKSREELETTVGDASTGAAIFNRLGFVPTFRYEKYRTEYERPGSPGIVTIDETPIGWFLELEGPPDWIDSTARELGFAEEDYVILSYAALYLNYCSERRTAPTHMLFQQNTLEKN
jgi:adenylate cyclase, class 2